MIQSLIEKELAQGEKVDLSVSKKGDVFRVEINTVEDEEEEESIAMDSQTPSVP